MSNSSLLYHILSYRSFMQIVSGQCAYGPEHCCTVDQVQQDDSPHTHLIFFTLASHWEESVCILRFLFSHIESCIISHLCTSLTCSLVLLVVTCARLKMKCNHAFEEVALTLCNALPLDLQSSYVLLFVSSFMVLCFNNSLVKHFVALFCERCCTK